MLAHARAKLEAKHLDLIIANPVPASFGGDTEQATLIDRDGAVNALPPMTKPEVAEQILDFVAMQLNE